MFVGGAGKGAGFYAASRPKSKSCWPSSLQTSIADLPAQLSSCDKWNISSQKQKHLHRQAMEKYAEGRRPPRVRNNSRRQPIHPSPVQSYFYVLFLQPRLPLPTIGINGPTLKKVVDRRRGNVTIARTKD